VDKLEFMRELEYSGYYLEDISERQSKLNSLNIYEACIVNDEYTMAIYEDENKGILDSLRSAVSSVLKLITHAIGLVIKTAKNIIDFGKYKHLEQKFSKNKNYKTKKVKIKKNVKIFRYLLLHGVGVNTVFGVGLLVPAYVKETFLRAEIAASSFSIL
jgi:hypothetical protein